MKLPNKVKVGGIYYTITDKPFEIDPKGTGAWGLTDHRSCIIYIDTGVSLNQVKDTLLHEILHAIFFIYNVDTGDGEERVVTPTASGLVQVFEDNKPIRDFLLK